MKHLSIIALFFISSFTIQAQDFQIPQNIQLETGADYKNSEELFLGCVKWLYETPVNTSVELRKSVLMFMMQWLTGSPSVTVSISNDILPPDCSECLFMYIGAWAEYSLNNNYSSDAGACSLAGIRKTISFYQKNKVHLGENETLEQYIAMDKEGRLASFIAAHQLTPEEVESE